MLFLGEIALAQSVASESRAFPVVAVRVSINSHDDRIVTVVESYIQTELRSLPDVKIVDDRADWELNVLALEVSAGDGQAPIGVVLSVAVLELFPNYVFRGEAAEMTRALSWFQGHLLRTGTRQDLRELCAEIVSTFDNTHLQAARTVRRQRPRN